MDVALELRERLRESLAGHGEEDGHHLRMAQNRADGIPSTFVRLKSSE
jgi:hypothetical protein